ncbi:glycerophosphodiester phosphodiesterase [Bacillus songklensis]|uniref:Glycerophosphodiester phosphodiesterase n=1 Tax=Bacillus songklensis TaxID=1069116 RepID=A0ABV8B335_9BACI
MLFVALLYILFIFAAIFAEELESKELQPKKSEAGGLNPRIKTVAHRGASRFAPENTLAAFDLAVQQKADYIEMDVQMAKDGELVVIHDPFLNRTTSGTGRIKDFSLNEMRHLDAGSWFNEEFSEEKLPALQEVLDRYSNKIGLLIELKDPHLYPGIERLLANELRKRKLHLRKNHSIIVQSFDYGSIKEFNRLLPTVPTGILLISPPSEQQLTEYSSNVKYINLYHGVLNHQLIKSLKSRGFKIFTWTVNERDTYLKMTNWDIDGVITDIPRLKDGLCGAAVNPSHSSPPYYDSWSSFILFVSELFQESIKSVHEENKYLNKKTVGCYNI